MPSRNERAARATRASLGRPLQPGAAAQAVSYKGSSIVTRDMRARVINALVDAIEIDKNRRPANNLSKLNFTSNGLDDSVSALSKVISSSDFFKAR
jgi:hypothetical protein